MTQSLLGSLQGAYSGLQAAQLAIEVTGQNIDNADTPGYIREQVEQTAASAPASETLFTIGGAVGQGVGSTSITQLDDSLLDRQVANTNANAGYSGTVSTALTSIETTLGEPSTDAISGQLQSFWAAWQGVSNDPGNSAAAGTLLGQAATLVSNISSAYQTVDSQWSATSEDLTQKVSQLNNDASQVAQLNAQITSTQSSGGDASSLIDERNNAVADIASLAGGSVSTNSNGSINISIGGANLVQGDTALTLQISGGASMEDAASDPVQLTWHDGSNTPASISNGEIAGGLSLLAPANASGTGGAFAETAAQLNSLATSLNDQVNAVSETGVTSSGATDDDFFALQSGVPAAVGLSVVPTDVSGIAVAASGAGAADGSIADQISQLGTGSSSPDASWASYVVSLGTKSQAANQQSTLDTTAQTSAVTAQQSSESVDLDQESMNLVTYQNAYEGAARVMTTIDQMLNTLITQTGEVGLDG